MTSEKSTNSTKESILTHALELFGQKGLAATSMRELASEAGVSLSAINYHFESKERLCLEVVKASVVKFRNHIAKAIEMHKEDSLMDLIHGVKREVLSQARSFSLTFKLLNDINLKDVFDQNHLQEIYYGPPGARLLFEHLRESIPSHVSNERLRWIVKCLFCYLDYHALLTSTGILEFQINHTDLNEEELNQNFQDYVQSLFQFSSCESVLDKN